MQHNSSYSKSKGKIHRRRLGPSQSRSRVTRPCQKQKPGKLLQKYVDLLKNQKFIKCAPKSPKSSSRSITRNFTPLRHTPRAAIKSECLSLRQFFPTLFSTFWGVFFAVFCFFFCFLHPLEPALFHFRFYAKLIEPNYGNWMLRIRSS